MRTVFRVWVFILGLGLGSGEALGAAKPAGPGAPPARAGADTLYLAEVNGASLTETYQYAVDDYAAPATPARAETLWRTGRFRRPARHRPLNLGLLHQRVWLRLAVVNTLSCPQPFLWSLYNFTDSATLYGPGPEGGRGAAVRTLAAASSWAVTGDRPFPARALCLPCTLAAGQRAVLWLRVEHRSGGIYFSTDVTAPVDFLGHEAAFLTDHHWIWLIGFYLSSALLSLMLFGFLRDRLYLWYALYVAAATLFLLMEDGLDAQVLPAALYRLVWTVGQYNWLLVAGACAIRIQQLFLGQRPIWPRWYAVGLWWARLALLWPLVCANARLLLGPVRWQAWLPPLTVGREVLLVGCLAYGLAALAVALADRRYRRLAAYYGLTFACFLAGCGQFWLNHTGFTNVHWVRPNTLAWGLFFELLLLSVLLTGRFRATLRQNARLRIRQLQTRTELGARLIGAQEEERDRLARDLHDAIAPALTALHLTWQRRAVREAVAATPAAADASAQADGLLRQIRFEVRTLSHALAPIHTRDDLLTSLTSLAAALDQPDGAGPRVLLEPAPDAATRAACLDHVPPAVATAAYRIAAELLHNAVRHADAAVIELTLTCSATHLDLTVTDDGRGLPAGPAATVEGLGLRSIRTRAAYLGGTVAVTSSAAGTHAVARLPLRAARRERRK